MDGLHPRLCCQWVLQESNRVQTRARRLQHVHEVAEGGAIYRCAETRKTAFEDSRKDAVRLSYDSTSTRDRDSVRREANVRCSGSSLACIQRPPDQGRLRTVLRHATRGEFRSIETDIPDRSTKEAQASDRLLQLRLRARDDSYDERVGSLRGVERTQTSGDPRYGSLGLRSSILLWSRRMELHRDG